MKKWDTGVSVTQWSAVLLVAGLLGTGAVGCGKSQDSEEAVAAEVGGRPIKLRRITDYLTALHVNYPTPAAELKARRQYLNRLIEDELLVIAGYARGIDADIGIVEAVDAEKDKFLMDELYRAEVLNKVTVSEEEIRDSYAHWFDRARFRHILVADSVKADSLLTAIKAGADFGDMAEKHSLDAGTRFRNGDFGREVSWTELTEPLRGAVFSLNAGELGGPIKTQLGWHVLQLDSKRKLDVRDYETVRPTIESILSRRKQQERRLAHLEDMQKRANLRYDTETLALWRVKLQAIADTAGLPQGQFPAVLPEQLTDAEKDRVMYRFGNDESVTLGRYCEALAARSAYERPDPADTVQLQQFAFLVSLYGILREEALRLDLEESPIYKERVQSYLENMMADRMRNTWLARGISVSDDEVRAFYDAHPDSFIAPTAYHIREVMVFDRNQALQLLQRAEAGTSVETLARQYTQRSGMKSKGGDLGWVTPDTYPDFYGAASKLQPGQVAGPLAGVDQYSIIQLIETRPSSQQTFEEVGNKLFERLQSARRDSVLAAFIDSMRTAHPVIVYEDALLTGLADIHGQVDSVGAR
ncbi:MAG: peptidyl-prolyl cis-trans isomerase [Candidatus Zixiibacteriota bacterium]